jgi:serine/threonine protein kinase
VCSGVQHAHTKGVIHRDLTPNNVLVTLQDGKPAATIIDCGLARATDHRLTEKTLFTEQGVILGTPEYMSSEQAGLNALDIDMRSDVYDLLGHDVGVEQGRHAAAQPTGTTAGRGGRAGD